MTALMRRGIYALPIAGVLTAVPWIFLIQQSSIKTDPDGWARGAISPVILVSGYMYLAGFMFMLFGLLALYGHLARTRASSWAAGGMILSVAAILLVLPIFGILILADTILSALYLAGHKELIVGMIPLSGGNFDSSLSSLLGIVLLIALLGAVAYGVAVWKSGSLPKWAGVLVALGFLLTLPISPLISWIGSACLVVGGVWLGMQAGQSPASEVASSRVTTPVVARG